MEKMRKPEVASFSPSLPSEFALCGLSFALSPRSRFPCRCQSHDDWPARSPGREAARVFRRVRGQRGTPARGSFRMSDSNPKPGTTGFEGKNDHGRAAAMASLRAKFGGQSAAVSVNAAPVAPVVAAAPVVSAPSPTSSKLISHAAPVAPSAPAAPSVASLNPISTDEIFLSPRVVDRQAFHEFSQTLKEMIDQAANGADVLRSAAADADRSRESLRDSMASQQAKLDLAGKAIATIDSRTDQTRRLIDGANSAVSKIDEIRVKADALIEDRIARLAARIDEVMRSAEAKIAAIDERLAPMIHEADRRIQALNGNIDAELAPSIAGLQHLCERADEIIGVPGSEGAGRGGLNDLVQRAERAKEEAGFAVRQLESVREQSEEAKRILSEAVASSVPLIDEVASVQGHLESTVARAVKLTTTTQETLTKQLDDQRTSAESSLGRLNSDCQRLKTELSETVEQATLARRAATQAAITGEEAAGHLTRLLDRLEPWHGVLLCRNGGDDLPPPLREVLDGVRIELKRDLTGVAAALRAVAERTEQVLDFSSARAIVAPTSAEVISESKPPARAESRRLDRDAAA